MKVILLFVAMLIVSGVAAETVTLKNCNITFNINKPHEIEMQQNDSILLIKTFDGWVNIIPDNVSDVNHDRYITLDKSKINNISSQFYVSPQDEMYAILMQGGTLIHSTLGFIDTADFLKSFHIERITKKKILN